MRVALLGASSATARRIARDLRELPKVSDLIEVETADSTIPTCDLLIGATDEHVGNLRVAEAAIDQGIPYLSSARDLETIESLLTLGEKAVGTGSQIVVGLGWTNGLSWALVRAALEETSDPTEIRISSVVSAAGDHGAAEIERMAGGATTALNVFEAGGWRRLSSAETNESVYFPEPLGWREVSISTGAEVGLWPRSFDGLQKVIVLSGISEPVASRLLNTTRKLGSRSATPLMRLASRAASGGQPGRAWSSIRADVTGRDGTSVSYAILDQLPNLLAAPIVAAVTLLAGDPKRKPGVVMPDSAFSHSSFLGALADRGVRAARLVR